MLPHFETTPARSRHMASIRGTGNDSTEAALLRLLPAREANGLAQTRAHLAAFVRCEFASGRVANCQAGFRFSFGPHRGVCRRLLLASLPSPFQPSPLES